MMHQDAAQEYVKILLDYQFDILWRRKFGENHAEFLYAQASATILRYPDLREWFVQLVHRNIFDAFQIDGGTESRPAGYIPYEFIFYFAHISRWPEFSDLANNVINTGSDAWRENPFNKWSTKLSDALTDEWEDRDFYAFGPAVNVV